MKLREVSKITKILLVAIPAVFVLSLGGFLLWQKYHKVKEAPVVINPVFQEIPMPHFPSVSGVSFAKDFQVTAAPNLTAPKDWSKTVKVYKIASQSGILKPEAKAKEIARKLGFSAADSPVIPSPLTNSKDAWIFQTGQNLLFVNKKDLSWDLELSTINTATRILTQEEVKAEALGFLKEKGFYQTILDEAAFSAAGFDSVDLAMVKPKDPANPEFWRMSWTLQKDGLNIAGSYAQAPLTALADRYGGITKLHYGVGEIELTLFGTYPARSFEAALQSVQEGKGTIVEISEPGKLYSSVLGEVQTFTPQEFKQFYYQDLEQGFLVPVIEFSGSATVSGKYYVGKIWLVGVSQEWLK